MKRLASSLLLCSLIIAVDQLTKRWVLSLSSPYIINEMLSFQVTINRGISWGILNDTPLWKLYFVTTTVLFITFFLCLYTLRRAQAGKPIWGELCVIAGSLSNSIDRFVHGGVIDFIVLQKGSWMWPSFNIADASIVFGVLCMFFTMMLYDA